MTIETRGALPICVEVPLIINAANNTKGFRHLPQELQISIISFTAAYRNYFNDDSDNNRNTFYQTLKEVHNGDGIRAMAFKVALRVSAEERRLTVSTGHI